MTTPTDTRPEYLTPVHLAVLVIIDVHDRKATSDGLTSPEITYTLNRVAGIPARYNDTNAVLSALRIDGRLSMYRVGTSRTKRFNITPAGRALLPPPAPTRR